MLTFEPAPTIGDFPRMAPFRPAPRRDGDVYFVGSGKAAIRLIFGYLRATGALPGKMTPVLVPAWLGAWVYAEMLPHAFPAIRAEDCRAVLCYHQYGFPQDMDRVLDIARSRKMVVVEDCAHACAGSYKERPLGTFGDFALYSFSKFAFCFVLGGVSAKSPAFAAYRDERIGASSLPLRWMINGFKLLDEANMHRDKPLFDGVMDGARAMAYSRYGGQPAPGRLAVNLWMTKKDEELAARRRNYALLRREAEHLGICDHLEADGVVPYTVPLAIDAAKAGALIARLRELGVDAGIRQFDYARCVFEPDWRPNVVVPIHSQMEGGGMERLLRALKETL